MGRGLRWLHAGRIAVAAVLACAAAFCVAGPSSAQATTQAAPPASNTQVVPPPLPGRQTPPVVVSPDSKQAPEPPAGTAKPTAAPQTTPAPGTPPMPPGAGAGAAEPMPKPSTPAPALGKAAEPKASGDASSAAQLTLEARPVALLKGKANWEEGFDTINASLKTIQDALKSANIKTAGHPLTVFRKTDDTGFEFEVMVPIDPAGDRKAKLASDVAFGQSPAGKVLKFQHRGAYEEIDSTYEAITAYLDEKGYDTKNLFMEEYLNRVKNADDDALKVDIYVLIK